MYFRWCKKFFRQLLHLTQSPGHFQVKLIENSLPIFSSNFMSLKWLKTNILYLDGFCMKFLQWHTTLIKICIDWKLGL